MDDPLVVRAAIGQQLRCGDEVWLQVERGGAMLFDQQAGRNLSLGPEVKSS
jgi:hypothetical protein